MQTFAFRLMPGTDLRPELERFAAEHELRAAFILTCVGSLSVAALRMAGRPGVVLVERDLEIVSLVGTLSPEGPHLHISVSDAEGAMTGGHLEPGSIVRTTAEVVFGDLDDLVFTRPICDVTGYDELVVTGRLGGRRVG